MVGGVGVIGQVRVGDLLASKLDEEQGAEIRDQQIFRSHAAFYEQEYHEVKMYRGGRWFWEEGRR